MKKISVIIPFLNEAGNVPNLCYALNNFGASVQHLFLLEVVFVDDGSNDNSVELLIQQEHRYYAAKIITLTKNYGSHAALRAGILNSTGETVTFIYADLQDPIELISEMYEKQISGCDIVWATRAVSDTSFFESLFSKTYAWLMQKFAISSFPEKGFDIVMFNEKVKTALNRNIEANSSIFLQILSLGFRQTAISYQKKARTAGKSKWTLSKKIKLLVDSFVAFSFVPIRMVTLIGITLFFVGTFWATYLISRKLIYNDLASGWAPLISILLIGFGVTNISLGIIAEYLWRTLDAARGRPVFIVDKIIDIQ